jgi:hypothetical protein
MGILLLATGHFQLGQLITFLNEKIETVEYNAPNFKKLEDRKDNF